MQHLLLDTTAGVTTVTLNRPDVRNAFNEEVITELTAVFLELGKRPEVRCVVLAGNGPCNRDRLAARRRSHEEGAWVREAAASYAAKRAQRQTAQAAE